MYCIKWAIKLRVSKRKLLSKIGLNILKQNPDLNHSPPPIHDRNPGAPSIYATPTVCAFRMESKPIYMSD